MSKSADFIFGLHFHQPVGNFDWILENAYQDAYKPLIDTFKKHKSLKLNLHISSPLLDFFKTEHPEFITAIKEEVEKGRIEMMGGGFYEPVLSSIPKRDIHGQLRKMEDFLRNNFNTNSRGIWLTERVWEPHLPSLLKGTNAEYLAVDDTHFIQAGFLPEKLTGYYLTEDAGNTLGIFIISKTLRYYIPFRPVSEVIGKFREYSEKFNNPLLCMLDDGEKFGVWPNTKEWVHGKGWLERFFKALDDNSSWLKMRTLSEYFDGNMPLGRAYLPSCQYYEMLQWAMPAEGALKVDSIKDKLKENNLFEETDPYITGGIWKNYFAKYPESNYANKKMLYLSDKLNKEKDIITKKELETALDHLYKSQCNCSYWHGVFGGIYLPHLRQAVHMNLNKTLNVLDKAEHKGSFIEYFVKDIDCDKSSELIINSDKLFLCVSPSKGGMIEDISDKTTSINHLDTIARRKETYHREILEEAESQNNENNVSSEGVDSIHDIKSKNTSQFRNYLNFDKYMRKSLIEHILPDHANIENFIKQDYESVITPKLDYSLKVKKDSGKVTAQMSGDLTGGLKTLKSVTVEKGKREFSAEIRLTDNSDSPVSFIYGLEFNFALLSDKSEEKTYIIGEKALPLKEKGTEGNIHSFGVIDKEEKYKVKINLNKQCELWYYPVRVVANSEGGFELSYQSTCMLPVFRLDLKPEEEFKLDINYIISSL